MELPIVKYKTHRVAYTVAAFFGLVPLCIGGYGLVKEDVSSFWNWILLTVGLIGYANKISSLS